MTDILERMKNFKVIRTATANRVLYQEEVYANDVADEYHTMSELYTHRMHLNAALFNYMNRFLLKDSPVKVMKSKLHFDGSMFDGYFIVMAVTHQGQISYHYKLEHWDAFRIREVERTPEWDQHDSNDVLTRLLLL